MTYVEALLGEKKDSCYFHHGIGHRTRIRPMDEIASALTGLGTCTVSVSSI
jgi:hypothetical protein